MCVYVIHVKIKSGDEVRGLAAGGTWTVVSLLIVSFTFKQLRFSSVKTGSCLATSSEIIRCPFPYV